MGDMSIKTWLKQQWYEPQLNKTRKKASGHRAIADDYRKKPKEKRSRREELKIQYNDDMADYWGKELNQLSKK